MYHAFRSSRRLVAVTALALSLTAALAAGATARSHHRHHGGVLSITSQPWGTVHGGTPVKLYTLSNGRGMTVKITNYGGVVQSIWVPDRSGRIKNVALGFSKLSDYENMFEHQPWPRPGGSGNTYFGAIIGRYANRIANAQFTLNGTTYHLGTPPGTPNNGPNLLHGGQNAWNTKVWDATPLSGPNSVSLRLKYVDPNLSNGFPGQVTTFVTYSLTRNNALRINYSATTDKDTVINLTNHTYFNLAGEGSGDVYHQWLKINADKFTPTNANLIPTGEIAPVSGTPFDFRSLKPIGRDIRDATAPRGDQLVLAHGFDHNWVLNGSGMKLASIAADPGSGRVLRTYTTEPGVQFYSGNFMVGDLVGTSRHTYRQTDGFTLETQHFPDSPNQPSFPSTELKPGQTFTSSTIYKFGVAGGRSVFGHLR